MGALRRSGGCPPIRLVISYALDWLAILALALAAYGFNKTSGYRRAFSLSDLSISYPFKEHETVPVWLAVVLDFIMPGTMIFIVCLFFVPGPGAWKVSSKDVYFRRKLWELHSGWIGLGLSLALTFMMTEGIKSLVGKPRPDLLSRCQPDVSRITQDDIGHYTNAALGNRWALVTDAICTQTNAGRLDGGFESFPSGHASFSFAGQVYLALFLISKFSISIPFLPYRPYTQNPDHTAIESTRSSILPLHRSASFSGASTSIETAANDNSNRHTGIVPLRNRAAAPPLYLLLLPLVPIGIAVWIATTRYVDYRHHASDLFAGSFLGTLNAYIGFRLFHLPTSRGAGWAWGARTTNRAFGVGVGVDGFVGPEGWGKGNSSGTRVGSDQSDEKRITGSAGRDGPASEEMPERSL